MVTLKAQKADSIFGSQGATKTYVRSKINAIPAASTPGGSTKEFQYNNAGAFGGTTNFLYTSSATAHGIYLNNTAKNASYEVGYNNTTEEAYLWTQGCDFKIGTSGTLRYLMQADGTSQFQEKVIFAGGFPHDTGGVSGDIALLTTGKVVMYPNNQFFPPGNLGIPDSDPGVAGELYTDGAPTAGSPKALYMSGG